MAFGAPVFGHDLWLCEVQAFGAADAGFWMPGAGGALTRTRFQRGALDWHFEGRIKQAFFRS